VLAQPLHHASRPHLPSERARDRIGARELLGQLGLGELHLSDHHARLCHLPFRVEVEAPAGVISTGSHQRMVVERAKLEGA
jgi:hypothetical protein